MELRIVKAIIVNVISVVCLDKNEAKMDKSASLFDFSIELIFLYVKKTGLKIQK